jgi:uncharacterized membrane protein
MMPDRRRRLLPDYPLRGMCFGFAIVLCLLARGAWKAALGIAVFACGVLGASRPT